MVSNSYHNKWQITTCYRTWGFAQPSVESMNGVCGGDGGLLCLLLQGLLASFGGCGVNACPEKAAQVRGWHARVLAYYLFLVSSLHAMWGKYLLFVVPTHPALRVKRLVKPCTPVCEPSAVCSWSTLLFLELCMWCSIQLAFCWRGRQI